MTTTARLPPLHLLACPQCFTPATTGLNLTSLACRHCGNPMANLAGLAAWFPQGQTQQAFWDSQLGLLVQGAQQKQLQDVELLAAGDLAPLTRARLQDEMAQQTAITQALVQLLREAGLKPAIAPQFSQSDPARMLQYHELLLRDWAWGQADDKNSENAGAWTRLEAALGGEPVGNCLVLGAGAGRLSWDLHRFARPTCTVALDNNPVLLSTAHRLAAQQRPWPLVELMSVRQVGMPSSHDWQLAAPPADPDGWFPLLADAWFAPFNPGSFDVVITPWFMDINGRDVRELIGLVSRMLKPGGRWINSGPLLYPPHLSPALRYSREEILYLAGLAGFALTYEHLDLVTYLKSPLTAQARHEQVWTFSLRAPASDWQADSEVTPPVWLQLAHLPIPANLQADHQNQPVLQHLLSLVDGKTSLQQIAALMAPNLEPGQDALALVRAVFTQMISGGSFA